jgi:hypothetical protein
MQIFAKEISVGFVFGFIDKITMVCHFKIMATSSLQRLEVSRI